VTDIITEHTEEISCLQLSLFCVCGYLTAFLVSELHIVERFVD